MSAIVHCLGKVKKVSELRHSESGVAHINFSFVQTTGFGENTHFDWYRATLFGRQAEALAGKLIPDKTRFSLCGRQSVKLYDREDGTTGYEIQVTVMDFQFAGEKPVDPDDEQPANRPAGKPKAQPKKEEAEEDFDPGF